MTYFPRAIPIPRFLQAYVPEFVSNLSLTILLSVKIRSYFSTSSRFEPSSTTINSRLLCDWFKMEFTAMGNASFHLCTVIITEIKGCVAWEFSRFEESPISKEANSKLFSIKLTGTIGLFCILANFWSASMACSFLLTVLFTMYCNRYFSVSSLMFELQ